MKQTKIKNVKEKRWIVATEKEIEEAREKGLYKEIISLQAKQQFNLCPAHFFDLILLVNKKIKSLVLDWNEHKLSKKYTGKNEEDFLYDLEQLLYILEDLYPCYFAEHKVNGKLDYKRWKDEFYPGWKLTELTKSLRLVRRLVAFPPNVEEFYQEFEKDDIEYHTQSYAASSVCGICGNKQANVSSKGVSYHENCAKGKEWYSDSF